MINNKRNLLHWIQMAASLLAAGREAHPSDGWNLGRRIAAAIVTVFRHLGITAAFETTLRYASGLAPDDVAYTSKANSLFQSFFMLMTVQFLALASS